MPIKPENMAKYPGGSIRSPEWLAIRERIRKRAGDCCEQCGVANSVYGVRVDGEFVDLGRDRAAIEHERLLAIIGAHGHPNKMRPLIRICCTVAHVDGELVDHSDDNLRFWCKRCHNRHDAKQRRANAARTIAEKSGQQGMFI